MVLSRKAAAYTATELVASPWSCRLRTCVSPAAVGLPMLLLPVCELLEANGMPSRMLPSSKICFFGDRRSNTLHHHAQSNPCTIS